MKPRLAFIFVVIVLLPLTVLGGLGYRLARNEQEVMRQRMTTLMQNRLFDVDTLIASVFERYEYAFLAMPPLSVKSSEELRQDVLRSPLVRQYFIMNDQDELRYPVSLDLVRASVAMRQTDEYARPADAAGDGTASADAGAEQQNPDVLTPDEKAFLERTSRIWLDKQIPGANGAEAAAPTPVIVSGKTGKGAMTVPAQPAGPARGWHAWYWGEGINLLFWWRDELGRIVGAELKPTRVMADIIGILPDSSANHPGLPEGCIALCDEKGMPVYKWGRYDADTDSAPLASLPLSEPLRSWSLRYYAAPGEEGAALGRSVVFNLIVGVAVAVLAVIVLAIYYYRESAREMREAQQRVSFVNQVSHELKTPLTSIRMYAELLEEELHEEDEKAARYIHVIVSESQRLSRLIGNVLTFGRQQRNVLKLHPTPGVIDQAIASLLEQFRPHLAAAGLQLTFDAHAGETVLFDSDVLEQILGNLLSNAEKYAASGGEIRIASSQQQDETTILVADNGPGVPLRDRRRIFEPFYRGSNKLTDGVSGAGIGLSIARDLAWKHGGNLTLADADQGACFKLTLQTPVPDEERNRT